VAATASSAQAGMGPEKTIDGSGLTGDRHGVEATTMWLSTGAPPNWVQYEFDKVYKLHDLKVWNSNQLIEAFVGFGAKKVTIETSTEPAPAQAGGTTWTTLANVPEFAKATGAGYAANTTVNLGGVQAKYVKLTIDTSWGGMATTGLSEVRFSYVPVQARAPQPANAAVGVSLETDLNWRPGREAASHNVFFGTDPNALTAAKTVTDHGYTPASLSFGTKYYWKVDEVNAVTYPGDVWSFTTQEYAVVDDFESYTDEEGNRIFDIWVDGWTNNTGSVIGNLVAPFAERTIIHGGKQSMPMDYNNIASPFYSEAELAFAPNQNWTVNGATHLSLWVRGNPANFVDKGNGAFTVSGSGHDIWDNADDFRFVFKRLTGDGSVTAKVESIGNTNGWAKAGVMIREALTAGSTHAAAVITPSNGMSFPYRTVADGASLQTNTTGLVAPFWLRITRTGNVFKAERSPDGKTWTAQDTTQTISMPASVYIGLCVSSHNTAATTTAEFSGVATTGNVTGAWQHVWLGDDPDRSNGAASLYVAVEDSTGKVAVASDPALVNAAAWTEWKVPLTSLTGVNLAKVKKLYLGVGDRKSPVPDGAGRIYIDDIGFGHPAK
jgi:regulation of enolase protein 1 (concanavalin A-like superfamily)